MPNHLEASIEKLIAETVAAMAGQIVLAVRHDLAARIAGHQSAPAAPAVKRGPGRPKKPEAAPAPAPAAAAAPAARRRGKRIRRNAAQLAADDARLLAFVKGHAGQRSSQLGKALGMNKLVLASGLLRLRDAGSIKTKGQKSAMTYSAA